jgi:hypothetical protein
MNPKTSRIKPKNCKSKTKAEMLFIAPKLLRNSRKMETNKIDKAMLDKTQAEESSPPLSSEWILRAKNIPPPNTVRIKIDNKAPAKETSPLLCS